MASEVEHAYIRALDLCRQMGEVSQLFPVLRGLHLFYYTRGEHFQARQLAEQLLSLAERLQDPALLVGAHLALGQSLFYLGEFAFALTHFERGLVLSNPQQHRYQSWAGGHPGAQCLGHAAWALWFLGYPDQALKRSHEALTLAEELSHPFTLIVTLHAAAQLHQLRREARATQERAEASSSLATELGFTVLLPAETILRGWALAEQEEIDKGTSQMQQGLAAWQAMGMKFARPFFLAFLAKAYKEVGKAEEGLTVLAEALALVDQTGGHMPEAELNRLKGELLLQKEFKVQSSRFKVEDGPVSEVRSPESEAEECFGRLLK
jgi:predicted ATPase